MIKWISKLPIFKDVYRQGGIDAFALAQKDILETMRDDLDAQAEELANKKIQDLFVGVDLNSVISIDTKKGLVYIGHELIDDARLANLHAEAESLSQFDLWNLLHGTPLQLAHQAMFKDDGKLENLLIKGRAIIFTLETQKKMIDILKSYQKK